MASIGTWTKPNNGSQWTSSQWVESPLEKENEELREEIEMLRKQISDMQKQMMNMKKEMESMEIAAGESRWKTFMKLEEQTVLEKERLIKIIKKMENG